MMKATSSAFPTDAAALARELDEKGFVCIENAVSPEWLAQAQSEVRDLLQTHGEKYFSLIRPADKPGSAADALTHDPRVHDMLAELTRQRCPDGIAEYEDVYNVMRIIAGPKGEEGSLKFHYDASVVTALVPVFIPEDQGGNSGALVTFANWRPYRSLLVNLVEKLIVQNRFYRAYMARKFERRPEKHMQLLKPGNIYFFWGYRTYHGNLACKPNSLRATFLLHYGNPHGRSSVLSAIRDTRKAVEQRRRAAA